MVKPVQKMTTAQRKQYALLRAALGRIGFLSQGSVLERPLHRGPRYQWTRKEKAKTITVALSQEQFHWLKQATANQRQLAQIIRRMQKISHQILFETVPGTVRRKRLSKKVLDAN